MCSRPTKSASRARRPAVVLALGAVLVTSAGLSPPPAAAAREKPEGATTLVSLQGTQVPANSDSDAAVISADGRKVAFVSAATNLDETGHPDTNGVWDVYVRDRVNRVTERVSVRTDGREASAQSVDPALNADGRYVAFVSGADDLVNGDTNNVEDVFVRDREARTTSRVTVPSAGGQADGGSFAPVLSADGRYVAFSSSAKNLVPGDTNDHADVFVRDRTAGTTSRVSLAADGSQAPLGGTHAAISADGRYVAFNADSHLVPGDPGDGTGVFVRDRTEATTFRVSIAPDGTPLHGAHFAAPAMSADGRYVAFSSTGDSTPFRVFVRDTVTGTTTVASVASDGTPANASAYRPAISADGLTVAYYSPASNLVADDSNGDWDVFVHESAGQTQRVSVDGASRQVDGNSLAPSLSANGRHVAFATVASGIVPIDPNNRRDVVVRDRRARPTPFGDLDGDGWSDVVVRRTTTGDLLLYRSDGTRLSAPQRIGRGWNGMDAILRHGDMDDDGNEDVVARETATGALWLYRGTGRAAPAFAGRVRLGAHGWNAMREITLVGDFDGDRLDDLVAVQASTGELFLYPGRGTSLGPRRLLGRGWNGMDELTGIGDTDLGLVDLVARQRDTADIWVYPGAGSWPNTFLGGRHRIGSGGAGWRHMENLVGLGDVDRDEWVDLAAVDTRLSSPELRVYGLRFRRLYTMPTGFGPGWRTDLRPIL